MEKPVQTTIHPDDVDTLMRDFDKTPEPNLRMVEAHRKAREIFKQQPMSKPSEKAMQLEQCTTLEEVELFIWQEDSPVDLGVLVPKALTRAAEIGAAVNLEALAEHQRVLELVDNVLASVQDYAATLSCTSQNESEVWNDIYGQTTNALAEISKLRKE